MIAVKGLMKSGYLFFFAVCFFLHTDSSASSLSEVLQKTTTVQKVLGAVVLAGIGYSAYALIYFWIIEEGLYINMGKGLAQKIDPTIERTTEDKKVIAALRKIKTVIYKTPNGAVRDYEPDWHLDWDLEKSTLQNTIDRLVRKINQVYIDPTDSPDECSVSRSLQSLQKIMGVRTTKQHGNYLRIEWGEIYQTVKWW